MEITDIRLKLINDATDRLKAVCTITFDDEFVVRDVKVVEGTGSVFVAMPSRKLSLACNKCGYKNHMRAKYCNDCGTKLSIHDMPADAEGRTRLHRDIAHPITASFRDAVQKRVIEAYDAERQGATDVDDAEHTDDAPAEEADEYSALIADLKGGRESGGKDGAGPSAAGTAREGAGESERGRTSESGPRRRSRGRRRDKEQADEPRETPAAAETGTSVPSASEVSTPAPADERDDVVPTGSDEQPSDDAVSLDEAAGEPVTSEESSEDTATFGAGL